MVGGDPAQQGRPAQQPDPCQEWEDHRPAKTGDQDPHQRYAQDKRQRPGQLGDRHHLPAFAEGHPVAKVGLHGGQKGHVAELGQEQDRHKGGPDGPGCHQSAAQDEQPHPGQHRNFPPAAFSQGRDERGCRGAQQRTQREDARELAQTNPQPAREDRQEGVEHAEGGVDQEAGEDKQADLAAQGLPDRRRRRLGRHTLGRCSARASWAIKTRLRPTSKTK